MRGVSPSLCRTSRETKPLFGKPRFIAGLAASYAPYAWLTVHPVPLTWAKARAVNYKTDCTSADVKCLDK